MSHPLLSTKSLTKNFGGVNAALDFDIGINRGEIVGLIGPNGAGKSTIFNLITGFLKPSSGDVYFKGEPITGKPPAVIARRGVGRTFQHIRLLKDLTVLENILVAFNMYAEANLWQVITHHKKFKKSEEKIYEESRNLLKLFHLEDRLNSKASNLPYGDQRFIEIVRALSIKPRILLLDEPTAGMNSKERSVLVDLILHINKEYDLAILLIEHHMEVVMNICSKIVVLNYGAKLTEGTSEEIQKNQDVIEAYLGTDEDA